jgi:uncharacterized membrane protein YqaE (UPF0057 family)
MLAIKKIFKIKIITINLLDNLVWFKIMDILRIICAIFVPPVGVFLQTGISTQLLINVFLTLLGYIPGIVHAVWIIAKE